MPIQIPAKAYAPIASVDRNASRSWMTEAKEILMLSLLAAAIVYTLTFVIIRAYI
jgi:hypothetical protein